MHIIGIKGRIRYSAPLMYAVMEPAEYEISHPMKRGENSISS